LESLLTSHDLALSCQNLIKGGKPLLFPIRNGFGVHTRQYNAYFYICSSADLQSHVQDLQEANESAVSELNTAERKINSLMKQNEGLQTAQNVNHQDLQVENRRLHDKVKWCQENKCSK